MAKAKTEVKGQPLSKAYQSLHCDCETALSDVLIRDRNDALDALIRLCGKVEPRPPSKDHKRKIDLLQDSDVDA